MTTSRRRRGISRPASRRRTGRTRQTSLGQALPGRAGRGLFGNSEVWVTETPSRTAAAILSQSREHPPAGALWAEAGTS